MRFEVANNNNCCKQRQEEQGARQEERASGGADTRHEVQTHFLRRNHPGLGEKLIASSFVR